MVDIKNNVTCVRCNVSLEFAGTKQFHEGSKWAEAIFGVWGENAVILDVYYCPTCGHVELFMDGIGEELRSRPEDF